MNRFLRLLVAELKELVRDRMALFWFVAFPVLFIVLFGMIFSGDNTEPFKVGVVVQAPGPVGDGLVQAFKAVDVFRVSTGTFDHELAALKKGDRTMVVVVPAEANRAVMNPGSGPAELTVYIDKAQQSTNQVLLPVLDQVLDGIERHITGRPKLLVVRQKAVAAEEFKYIDFLLPGILAMALMQLGLFGALHLVSLRERKILKALGATPLPRGMLLGSEILVRLIISVVQTLLIVVIGRLAFDVHIISPWYEVLGLVLLGAGTFVSLGYMLCSFSRTEESAQGLIQFVQFPMMFLSGVFFPLNVMPQFLKPVIRVLPLTYLGDALRHVMVGSPSTYSMGTNLLVLSGTLLGTMLLAILFWRWE